MRKDKNQFLNVYVALGTSSSYQEQFTDLSFTCLYFICRRNELVGTYLLILVSIIKKKKIN